MVRPFHVAQNAAPLLGFALTAGPSHPAKRRATWAINGAPRHTATAFSRPRRDDRPPARISPASLSATGSVRHRRRRVHKRNPAVDDDHRPGHIVPGLGGEIDRRARHVFIDAHPP